MLKLRYLFDNRDLALMLLNNWNYDKKSLNMLKYFRISANAIYPYKHNEEIYVLRFLPWNKNIETEMNTEINFLHYLRKNELDVLEPVLSKDDKYLLKKNTPWGEYLVCSFKRVAGEQISELEYNDDIIYGMGKTLGKFHKLSSKYTGYQKESCFDILDNAEVYAKKKLKKEKMVVLNQIDRVRNIFKDLSQNVSNFGLVHYDFEPDNVFYDEETKKLSIIDFGSSIIHWYTMDIEQSINSIKAEFSHIDYERIKTIFLNGYKTEYHIQENELELFPVFRCFDELRSYINLKDVVEEAWDNEPKWMVDLRKKINNKILKIENNMNKVV